jgi:hypothetical protein
VHLSPRGEIQLRLTALNFPEHYGNTAGTTTYTTTSYVPMGGGGIPYHPSRDLCEFATTNLR